MITGRYASSFRKAVGSIDLKLLLFLLLFMNVKLAVKIPALLLLCLLQPNFKFGFRLKNSRLPLFYPVVMIITVLNYLICRDFSADYTVVTLVALLGWAVCILAVHRLKLFVGQLDLTVLHNTLLAFFMINAVFSFLDIAAILTEIGLKNPYRYQGLFQKYFINTGDRIRGVLFDVSTTNAFINCFGVIFFLYRHKFFPAIICMAALLLTASNTGNILLMFVFAGLFIFRSTREQKSVMLICFLLLTIFLAKLSPQNNSYLSYTIEKFFLKESDIHPAAKKIIPIRERPDSLLTPESRKEKTAVLFLDSMERQHRLQFAVNTKEEAAVKPEIPKDSIHTASFQWKRDTTDFQRTLLAYMKQHGSVPVISYEESTPGKLLAFKQSFIFLKNHSQKIWLGAGAGRFSSKLAFRATGLNIAGGFPQKYLYCNPDFLNNHLNLYTHFFLRNAESHSVIHNPGSVYDQLLTEYGLIGCAAFIFLYIGFFVKDFRQLSFGIPLLLMLLGACMIDYWFEQLSVIVLFELMMFTDLKEKQKETI